jgi:hypothetical protein
MQRVPMGDLGMMGGFFVIAGLVMFRGLAMMLCGVLVMLGRLCVMFVDVVAAHCSLPGLYLCRLRELPGSVKQLRRSGVSTLTPGSRLRSPSVSGTPSHHGMMPGDIDPEIRR